MTKYYYREEKKNVEYVIEICICSLCLQLKRCWLNDEDVPSELWVGAYLDAKTCVEKAKTDFDNSFNKKDYKMTIKCRCWKKIPTSMRNINKEELDYAK